MRGVVSGLVALALSAASPFLGASAAEKVAIPAGAVLKVRLDTTITSKTNKAGDTFTGLVKQPIVSGDQTVVPEGSLVSGHIAFLKPSGRIKGKAQMRIVLDSVSTPEEQTYRLSGTLEDSKGGVCGSTASDGEGTIIGCGKSKKDAAKDAGLGAAIGAGAGATVGMGSTIDCRYFGNCGGPGIGTDVALGAGAGAATALLYNLFKHEKEIILLQGSELTFIINRTVEGPQPSTPQGTEVRSQK